MLMANHKYDDFGLYLEFSLGLHARFIRQVGY